MKGNRIYKCKVLTQPFLKEVELYIMRNLSNVAINAEAKRIKHTEIVNNLRHFWNGQAVLKPDLPVDGLSRIEIPEYEVKSFVAEDNGLTELPKILWNGRIENIQHILEIFHYECETDAVEMTHV